MGGRTVVLGRRLWPASLCRSAVEADALAGASLRNLLNEHVYDLKIDRDSDALRIVRRVAAPVLRIGSLFDPHSAANPGDGAPPVCFPLLDRRALGRALSGRVGCSNGRKSVDHVPEDVTMTRRVRNALKSLLGLGAVGATQRYLVHRLVVEVAEAEPQQQTWAGTRNDGAMQAVAVAAEGLPCRAVKATRAVFEKPHCHRCDDLAVPPREAFDVRAGDSTGLERPFERLHVVRRRDVVVGAFFRTLDRSEEGEDDQRPIVLPVAMEQLRIGMGLAIGNRPERYD